MRGIRRGPPPPGAARALRWLTLLVVVGALAFAIRPLLGPHQISGHSTYSDLVRAEALHQAVRQGDWTPRWLPDFYFRHGSPTFHYYAPGGYYLIELLRRLGASALWAHKLAFLLPWLLGAVAMFRWTTEAFGRAGAGIATVAYALAPYFLIDVYMRNGIAEAAAFGLFPCALWATWRAAKQGGAASWLLASAASAALALTHNITSLVATPILLGLALVAGGRPDKASPRDPWGRKGWSGNRRAAGAVILGLVITAFFWLPALVDRNQVTAEESLTGGYFDYQQHFLDPLGVVSPGGGGTLVIGPRETASLKLGMPLVIGLVGGLLVFCVGALRRRLRSPATAAYCVVAALVCLAMTTPLSSILWRHLPLLPFVQFPWRFLLPATCLAAPLVGLIPEMAPRRARRWIRIAMILLVVSVATPYVTRVYLIFEPAPGSARSPGSSSASEEGAPAGPGESVHVPAANVQGRDSASAGLLPPHKVLTIERIREIGVTGTAGHDFLPRAVTRLPRTTPPPAEVLSGAARVVEGGWGYPSVWADIEVTHDAGSSPGRVALGQFWFPGWTARIDGEAVETSAEPGRGRIVVELPASLTPGRHRLEARFGTSGLVWLGRGVSLLGLLTLFVLIARERRIQRSPLTLAAR